MSKLVRDRSTKEKSAWWDAVLAAAARAKEMPEWMRQQPLSKKDAEKLVRGEKL